MEDQKKIPLVVVIILAIVLFSAIGIFILRKQAIISPVPDGNNVRVIFTSPPPSNTPVPSPTPANSPTPTKKPAATKKPTPTVTEESDTTPTVTKAPTSSPTPTP